MPKDHDLERAVTRAAGPPEAIRPTTKRRDIIVGLAAVGILVWLGSAVLALIFNDFGAAALGSTLGIMVGATMSRRKR